MEFSHYEGDQSALYSGEHHMDAKSPESKSKVKNIIKVTGILTVVTIVEVGLGLYGHSVGMPKWLINTFFILLTLFKAGYIVKVFMHLGDELKNMILTILIPLTLFFWFILAFLWDGSFWLWINHAFGIR
ncbi:MAG TPA: cytochrome C oxidase subunit IV family protein [Chitinophagaceae bacterium]|nr:cytochrome C oxidase subunit IV family protein [Chitinophagaceae bacterium]